MCACKVTNKCPFEWHSGNGNIIFYVDCLPSNRFSAQLWQALNVIFNVDYYHKINLNGNQGNEKRSKNSSETL